jgi:glycosyltransferase involved in cell wall biosynthesis
VTFVPGTNRVVDWLRRMDIFVLPSRSEALSNSLMEAMACGCAVVASRVGGNVELVETGRTGLLFASGDAAQLRDALELLIRTPALRAKLGAAACCRMREAFSLAESTRRMSAIYAGVLNLPA